MSAHDYKLKSLVDVLITKTAFHGMVWEVSPDGESVKTKLSSGTITISPDRDASGQDAVRVFVADENGNVQVSFDDTEVYDWDASGQRISYYRTMKSLLDDAIRSARGEAKLLDNVLSELGVSDDDVPF